MDKFYGCVSTARVWCNNAENQHRHCADGTLKEHCQQKEEKGINAITRYEDIANALNLEEPYSQGKTVVYYRVSTHVQKTDLEHQRQALETYALNALLSC